MLAEAGIEPAWADFKSTNLYIQISNLSSFQFCKCFISICLNVKVIKGLMLRCGIDFTPHSSVPWTIQRSSISEADVTYGLTAELLLSAMGYTTVQQAQRNISHFLMHRYNWIRPHQFNGGLPPAQAGEKLNVVSGIS